MESKTIAQDDQRGQAGVPTILMGSRPTNKRGSPDAQRPTPIELTPKGEFRVYVPPPRWVRMNGVTLGTGVTTILRALQDFYQVRLYISNVDTSSRTFALYHFLTSGAAADANAISKNVTLPANSAPIVYELGMSNGETIQGLCDSADKVSATAYVLVIQ